MNDILWRERRRPSRKPTGIAIVETLEARALMDAAAATTTTIAASTTKLRSDQPLTLTATVAAAPGVTINEGVVTFREGSAVLGTAPVVDNVARFTPNTLAVGSHRYSASYSGTDQFQASGANPDGSPSVRPFDVGAPSGYPMSLAFDRSGNLYFSILDPSFSSATIRKRTPDGQISTVGPGSATALAIDASGNIFWSHSSGDRIYKLTPDGKTSVYAGDNPPGFSGDGGPVSSAQFDEINGLAFDNQGNLFIADGRNLRIRKVTPDGIISTVAGTGGLGQSGDGGPATSATFFPVHSLATDGAGNLFIVDGYHVIRKLTPEGIITTYAGNGNSGDSGDGGPANRAQLGTTLALATDVAGNLYIAYTRYPDGVDNSIVGVIRKVTPDGLISTIATSINGVRLGDFGSIAVDRAGTIYVGRNFAPGAYEVTQPADVVVTPAPARLAITGLASPVVAGTPQTVTVSALDEAGNVLTAYDGSVLVSTTDFDAFNPTQPFPRGNTGDAVAVIPVALRGGVGTFTVIFRAAGTQTLTVSDPANPNLTVSSPGVVVTPAAAARFNVDPAIARFVAGGPLAFTVTATDAFGNPTTDYAGAIRFGFTDPTATLPADTPLVGGTGTFTLVPGSAGFFGITVTDAADPAVRGGSYFVPVEGMVRGVVFRDRNADGVAGPGEPGLPGRVVVLDGNGNGVRDDGEPTATTDADGTFRFPGVVQGTAPVLVSPDLDPDFRNAVIRTRTLADGSVAVAVVPSSPLAPAASPLDPFAVPGPIDPNTTYVRSLYRAVLGRDGSDFEVGTWVDGLRRGTTQAEVAAGFVNSPEHRLRQVRTLYQTLLHRDVDPSAQVWVDALRSGTSEQAVAAAILGSYEYQTARADNATFARDLYRDVLGRNPDPVGLANLRRELDSGRDRSAAIAAVVGSDEAIDQALDSLYTSVLRRRRDSFSSRWSDSLRSGAAVTTILEGLLASDEFFLSAQPAQRT